MLKLKSIPWPHIRRGFILAIGFIAILWSARPAQNNLEKVLNEGMLHIAARLGPLTYYERDSIPNGLDYNILAAFADSLGVAVEFRVYDGINEQLEALDLNASLDLASATFSVTEDRLAKYQFSAPYLEVDTLLIQHRDYARPKNLLEVVEKGRSIVAVSGTSHTELLRELTETYPELTWEEEAETIMFQLLERVQNKEIDMAVVDSSIFDLEASLFPNVEVALTLERDHPVAFVFAQSSDNSLVDALDEFLLDFEESGELDTLLASYLDPEPSINVAGSLLFNRRIDERLPEYEPLFKRVAKEYDYSWILLAAQAYQESHWNAKARSPTGVRGLMMLTLPTARELGVNRLDAIESLEGGMKYLHGLRTRLPEDIIEPDRTKFALAAYNVGYGHVQDARLLTRRGGDNPNSWTDVQQYLPLLRQKKYYSTTKFGYARGSEPVHYVNNIYRFANILDWYAWQRDIENETLFADASDSLSTENTNLENDDALALPPAVPAPSEEVSEPN